MNLAPVFRQRFFDQNGAPLAGGLFYSYLAGTTTPQATYSNSGGTANTNPVVLDSQGYADVWLDPTLAYKFVLKDSGGVTLWTTDNVTVTSSGISTWNTNQAYVQGSIVQDSSGFGLLYVSLISNNVGNALTNVSAWRVFGGNVRTLSTNATLAVTDDLVRSNSTSGNLTHTLPACASTPIGKRITVKDVGTGGNSTSVKGSGTDNVDGNNTFADALVQNLSITVENNGNSWDVLHGYFVPDKAVTQGKLANRTTGTTVAAGGVAISASSGSFSTSSGTLTPVTNLSVTITTTGRPVLLMLMDDGSNGGGGNNSMIAQQSTSAGASAQDVVAFFRGITQLTQSGLFSYAGTGTPEVGVPPSAMQYVDLAPAGTYTYTVKVSANVGSVVVWNTKLVAYEL